MLDLFVDPTAHEPDPRRGRIIAVVKGAPLNGATLYARADDDVPGTLPVPGSGAAESAPRSDSDSGSDRSSVGGSESGSEESEAREYSGGRRAGRAPSWRRGGMSGLRERFAREDAMAMASLVGPRRARAAYRATKGAREPRAGFHESGHVINLPPGAMFQLVPNPRPDDRDVGYIVGPGGSGKSTLAANFARTYAAFWRDWVDEKTGHEGRKVYLVSKKPKDPVFDEMPAEMRPLRLPVSEVRKRDWKTLRNSLVIFDDCDTFTPAEKVAVLQLQDDLAALGRASGISLLVLMHRATNYKETRLMLGEAHFFVVFSTMSHSQKRYLLRTTVGLEDKAVRALRHFGRWACVRKEVPQLVIGASSACDLEYLDELARSERV